MDRDALSKKHALVAVAFAGVNRVRERDYDTESIGASQGIDKRLYLKWLGLTAKGGAERHGGF